MDVTTLILTLNEENNLPRCLKSLSWCKDIVVLDSFSTDSTKSIANKAGGRFVERPFDNYANQRNFGLKEIDYRTPWLLMVDADEEVSPELAKKIQMLPDNTSDDICLYHIRRKDFFWGKWIRRSSGYPTWFGRLMKLGRVHVERAINEEYHTDGQVAFLEEHLLHYPFNNGFHNWFEKHNRYSSMEAEAIVVNKSRQAGIKSLFSTDPVQRRKAIKQIVYSLPGRPILIFCALYFLRLGFLDGSPGFTYCVLRAIYEYMIDCKVKELRRRKQDLPL